MIRDFQRLLVRNRADEAHQALAIARTLLTDAKSHASGLNGRTDGIGGIIKTVEAAQQHCTELVSALDGPEPEKPQITEKRPEPVTELPHEDAA